METTQSTISPENIITEKYSLSVYVCYLPRMYVFYYCDDVNNKQCLMPTRGKDGEAPNFLLTMWALCRRSVVSEARHSWYRNHTGGLPQLRNLPQLQARPVVQDYSSGLQGPTADAIWALGFSELCPNNRFSRYTSDPLQCKTVSTRFMSFDTNTDLFKIHTAISSVMNMFS